jgi:hypothetical protein
VDQHGGVGVGDQADLLEHRLERRAQADDLLEVVDRLDLVLELAELLLGPLPLLDVAQDERMERAAPDLDLRDGRLDRELASRRVARAKPFGRPDPSRPPAVAPPSAARRPSVRKRSSGRPIASGAESMSPESRAWLSRTAFSLRLKSVMSLHIE